jgi:hypothetical protein
MKKKNIIFLLLGLIFFLDQNLLRAAEIDIYSIEEIVNIRLVGIIEKGDAENFKRIVEDLKQKKRTVNMLMLASIGGDALEAMSIGTIVRESFIPTQAPFALNSGPKCNGYPPGLKDDDCDCSSACFLIWVAGIYRMGDVIGIHRPYFLEEYLEGLSASERQKEYDLIYEKIRSYMKNMDVPEHIINKMFNTAPEEIAYLDFDIVKSMKSVPFFDEWVEESCLQLTSEEKLDYWRLLAKKWKDENALTESEKFYFNYIKEKINNFNNCFKEKFKETQLKEKKMS